MTTPTNAELEALVRRYDRGRTIQCDENHDPIISLEELNHFHSAARELLALRTGRHETHFLAPNTHTEAMENAFYDTGRPQGHAAFKYFDSAYQAMRSAAIEGEKKDG